MMWLPQPDEGRLSAPSSPGGIVWCNTRWVTCHVRQHTSIKKVDSTHSPLGSMGQKYLASGVTVSMRLWEEDSTQPDPQPMCRDYEVVGYVIKGSAELEIEDQKIILNAGDSWVVPREAVHRYRILEPLVAVEATAPPAHIHERDKK